MSDPLTERLHGAAVYNPDLLSKQELIDQFVGRHALLTRLVDDLRAPRPQHKLIVGTRGMGKTTLLRRVRHAIEDDATLSNRWLPLVFPEEQYNVTRLADFYINCIDSLSDRLEESGHREDARKLDEFAASVTTDDHDKLADLARDFLLTEVSRLNKGLVLLIDNADLILDGLPEHQEWAFRELLSHEERLVLVGATVRPIEAEFKYGKAFHDFFQVHELRGFTEDETRQVLKHFAQVGGTPHVDQWLDGDSGRLKTLNTLTGGNPRTVVLLYHLLAQGAEGTVRSDLERLLDLYTPNYKARFEELPKQAQQVLDALALHWDPATAADVTKLVRSDINAVSSQLSRLVKQGIVEQVSYYPGPKSGYQIAERFFNIWYLMRASRRIRRKLQWLVEFLRLFYNQDDLKQQARRHLRPVEGFASLERLKHAEYCFCLAQAIEKSSICEALETAALHSLLEDRSLRRDISTYVDLEGHDTALKSKAERMLALKEAREAVLSAEIESAGMSPGQFWNLLGGVPSLSVDEKREIAHKLSGLTSKAISALSSTMERELARYKLRLGDVLAERLSEALRCGFMANVADVDGARTVAETQNTPEVVALALAERLRQTPSREVLEELDNFLPATKCAYVWLIATEFGPQFGWSSDRVDSAINRLKDLACSNPESWDSLSGLLHDLGRYSEALDACQQAVQLDPADAERWFRAGALLANHFDRFEEAEEAYRRALSLLPDSARTWDALGDLLRSKPERQQEAEHAYRRAISLDPKLSDPWLGLASVLAKRADQQGQASEAYDRAIALTPERPEALERLARLLLKQTGRGKEAEQACRKAISLDPKRAQSWCMLGDAIRSIPGRQAEAEEAYQNGIIFDPDGPEPLVALGNLLADEPNRLAQAEEVYRKALLLNSNYAPALAQLGLLLSDQSGREAEAEEALRRAISVRPTWAYPWGVLGDLLFDQRGREAESEEAYLKAGSLDPKWPNPWGRLGDVLSRQHGREADAEKAYRMTIALDPTPPNPWANLGRVLARQPGREAEAVEAFEKAIAIDQDWASAWIGLGELMSAQAGREEDAETAYRKATSIEPDWREAWNRFAWILYKHGKGNTEEAEDAARKGVTLSTGVAHSHTLATILVCRGKWPEAKEHARRFIMDGTEDFYEQRWPEIIEFFREAVKAGYAKQSIELLTEVDLAERWRPLREALAAVAEGTRAYLRRVAPEVREPADKILNQLVPQGWDLAKPRRRKSPSRNRRGS